MSQLVVDTFEHFLISDVTLSTFDYFTRFDIYYDELSPLLVDWISICLQIENIDVVLKVGWEESVGVEWILY
jgi:hypothetical protein